MNEYYYKVLKKYKPIDGVYISATGKITDDWSLLYMKDQWTIAPPWLSRRGYYICLFSELPHAANFRKEIVGNMVSSVWLCKCAGRITRRRPGLPQPIEHHSLSRHLRPIHARGANWPVGTVMAEKVMPVEIVLDINYI